MPYRLSIGLFGKGSANHLHRKKVVELFRKKGIEGIFNPQISQTRLPLQGTSGQVTRITLIT